MIIHPGTGAALLAALTLSAGSAMAAPVHKLSAPDRVPNQFIVVYKSQESIRAMGNQQADIHALAREAETQFKAKVKAKYSRALNGMTVTMSEDQAWQLAQDPRVAYIEADTIVRASGTQTGSTWGLDRIDQRQLPLNQTYHYANDGAGVNVYVIDTGVRTGHAEFEGRARAAYTAIQDGRGSDDCDGHGTHVAGTIAGKTYGVAKKAAVHAVRVLGCGGQGTNSSVLAGVEWVTSNHQKPALANMSLGGPASQAIDDAVRNSVRAGVTYVVAAGNENQDACQGSPGRVNEVINVGSTTSQDSRSSFSNYGRCLDLFAPGSDIQSAWHTSNSATNTISGTSMASPHVAGVAALYLAANRSATPTQVEKALVDNSVANLVRDAGYNSPNRLLYAGFIGTGTDGGGDTGGGTGGGTGGDTGGSDNLCVGCQYYNGFLYGSGYREIQPKGSYFYSNAGNHKAVLAGPAGTDYNLKLYQWRNNAWTVVAQAVTPYASEILSYKGTAGYYYWSVESRYGAGAYHFWMGKP